MKLSAKHYVGAAVLIFGALAPLIINSYELSLLGRFLALSILAMGIMLIWGEGGILVPGPGGVLRPRRLCFGAASQTRRAGHRQWRHAGLHGVERRLFAAGFLVSVRQPLVLHCLCRAHSRCGGRGLLLAGVPPAHRGVYFALITQALALAFSTLLISQQAYTGGFNGLTDYSTFDGYDITSSFAAEVIYWITFVLVAVSYFFLRWLLTTRWGIMLRATRDGENRVRFLGHNPLPYKVGAFTIAGILAGIGGALFTLHAGVVSPALVGVVPSIEMVVWVALGGRNVLWGAIAGTLLVNFAKDQISSALPSLWLYGLGALFILAVSFLPAGIAGLFKPGSPEERVARRFLTRRKLETAE